MQIRYSLRDIQCDPVVDYCRRCKVEIYAEEAIFPGDLCEKCWEEENGQED